jgi:hypothetical protein
MRADLVDSGFRWMTQKTALQLEPVVGIGRFDLMYGVKFADLLRKSTSLGKSLSPSTSHFTGQFSGQFPRLKAERLNQVRSHSQRPRHVFASEA